MKHNGFFRSLKDGDLLKLTTCDMDDNYMWFTLVRTDESSVNPFELGELPRLDYFFPCQADGSTTAQNVLSAINDALWLGGYQLSFRGVYTEGGELLSNDWEKFCRSYVREEGNEQAGYLALVFEKLPE